MKTPSIPTAWFFPVCTASCTIIGMSDLSPQPTASAYSRGLTLFALFLSFLLFSALRAPVPGVNEPHYLTKAKHYWNPQWCADDFFLNSANAHLLFYQTVGLLTRWLTLSQTAWVSRIIALALLAWGWERLFFQLTHKKQASLFVAWAFLCCAAIGNLSGEWIVGGIESKVFAFGLLFWSIGTWLDQHPLRASILMGLAISIHPVVGIWGLFAALFAEISSRFLTHSPRQLQQSSTTTYVKAAGLTLLCALPGLIPALQLLTSGGANRVDSQMAYNANYLQVYRRLKHHLDPMEFSPTAWIVYGVLTLCWIIGMRFQFRRRLTSSFNIRWYTLFVVATALFALAGLLIGFRMGDPKTMWLVGLRINLLKFYPFRMFDVMLPISISLMLVQMISSEYKFQIPSADRLYKWMSWLVFPAMFIAALLMPVVDAKPKGWTTERIQAWQDVCNWINNETKPSAHVLTPRSNWAFRWFAERADYVTYKDCPQDVLGIMEWYNRRKDLHDWAIEAVNDGEYSEAELKQLYDKRGITHILVDYKSKNFLGPFAIDPIFENNYYRLYSLLHE